MTKKRTKHGCQIVLSWHVDKPMLLKPKILAVRFIDGVKHYTGLNGKLYIAELFDKMFKPAGV